MNPELSAQRSARESSHAAGKAKKWRDAEMARQTLGGIASGGRAGSIIRGMGADQATPKGLPALDGTFAIVTDGEILANNTDDGSRAAAEGLRRLAWSVTPRTVAAPTALIRLGR